MKSQQTAKHLARYLTFAVILILAACANHSPWVWSYMPMSEKSAQINDANLDFRRCIASYDPGGLPDFDAGHGYPAKGRSGNPAIIECMKERGWSKVARVWVP